jgi:CRISPR-associated protein Csh2
MMGIADRIDEETSKDHDELRNVRDLTLDVDDFVERLSNASGQIERVRIVASDVLQVSYDGKSGGPERLYEALRDAVGPDRVDVIDVYEEYSETLPTKDDE